MDAYFFGKDITTDLVAGDVDFDARRFVGEAAYEFHPKAIFISPSAEDKSDEYKSVTFCMAANGAIMTLIMATGVVHPIAVGKIFKTGTTTSKISVLGNL